MADTFVFTPLTNFVRTADLVALVRVTSPGKNVSSRIIPGPAGYSKSTQVHVIEILKGEAPADFTVWHGKRLSDHLFQRNEGRYLVFLKRTGDAYTPVEGHPASKFIQDDEVLGWSDSHHENYRKPLAEVLAWIKKEVASK